MTMACAGHRLTKRQSGNDTVLVNTDGETEWPWHTARHTLTERQSGNDTVLDTHPLRALYKINNHFCCHILCDT